MRASVAHTAMTRPVAQARPRAAARPPRAGELLQRKSACACGGGCPRCRAASAGLAIGAANDRYEQEADRVAARVMRAQSVDEPVTAEPPEMQRKCAACDAPGGEAPSSVRDTLSAPGRPLATSARSYFEPLFGRDFSDVRVHTDAAAGRSAQDVRAHAYTVGRDIVFAPGQFAPDSSGGRRLLAHELTHVVQQSGGGGEKRVSRDPEDEEETPGAETEGPQSMEAGPADATELEAKSKEAEKDPCTYKGKATKDREIHLNLGKPAVRVYQRGSSHVQFDNIIIGPGTSQLAEQNGWCHMYSVQAHQSLSSKGLIHFVNYCGNFGFHSNFWKKDGAIERIPGSQSHGCARLHDDDEKSTASGDSKKFYDLVENGDCVRIYSRSFWRQPTFKPCSSDGKCKLDG